MSNTIELAKSFVPKLDERYRLASLTSVRDGAPELAKQGANANELIIPMMSMDGLADYSRNGGYVQGGVRADIFGELGQRDGFAGVVGARAGDDGNAFVDLLDADADGGFMLVVGHRGGFAGGAAGHHAVHALFNLPFNVGAVGLFVDGAILERGKQSSYRTVKHVFLRAG